MEKNIGLNELIYDYYESRILFGHYKYGDPLPSIRRFAISSKLDVIRFVLRLAV